MRVLIVALLLAPVPVLADIVRPATAATCAVDDRIMAAARAGQSGFQRLDRLPPAAEFLTVYRTIDRCPAPVIARYDIGGARR